MTTGVGPPLATVGQQVGHSQAVRRRNILHCTEPRCQFPRSRLISPDHVRFNEYRLQGTFHAIDRRSITTMSSSFFRPSESTRSSLFGAPGPRQLSWQQKKIAADRLPSAVPYRLDDSPVWRSFSTANLGQVCESRCCHSHIKFGSGRAMSTQTRKAKMAGVVPNLSSSHESNLIDVMSGTLPSTPPLIEFRDLGRN